MEFEYRLRLPPFDSGVIDELVALGAVVFGQIEAGDVAWRLAHQPDPSVFCVRHGTDLVAFKAGYALTTRRYYSWLGGVHPDHRRRGLAAELMNRQHRWAAERGYAVVETAANQENHVMATVNLRHGFSVCGVRSDPQRTQVLFSKSLRRS